MFLSVQLIKPPHDEVDVAANPNISLVCLKINDFIVQKWQPTAVMLRTNFINKIFSLHFVLFFSFVIRCFTMYSLSLTSSSSFLSLAIPHDSLTFLPTHPQESVEHIWQVGRVFLKPSLEREEGDLSASGEPINNPERPPLWTPCAPIKRLL